MDSSEPPNSHPGPHSRSRSRTGSSVVSEPDLGGSVKASASSVGYNEPELPPQGGDSSKCQGKKISTGDEPKDDQDVNIAYQSTPKKRYQSESSKGKAKVENTTDREEEITLLESIIDYYDEKGTYPFVGLNLERKFSKDWIEEHGVLADTLILDFKILELHARFLLNELNEMDCDRDVVGAMDPIDVKIYQLSNRNWGKKDNEDLNNSAKEKTVDDHGGVNPIDSGGKTVDDCGGVNPKSSEDSSEQYSGDDRGDKKGTEDSTFLKDLTEQESDCESDKKDSSEGETNDESDTEDSKSKLIETSDVSDSKDSTDSSSEDLTESETDESDTKHSSSTGSKNSSETETNDDHEEADARAVHLLRTSLMRAGIGIVIMIIMALIIAIREI